MATAELKRHWFRVAALGCCIDQRPAEIAHAHGPSLSERGFSKPKGKKFRWQDWLVIPACPQCHRLDTISLDNALTTWEAQHGTCAHWLDWVCEQLSVDVWMKAKEAMRWK